MQDRYIKKHAKEHVNKEIDVSVGVLHIPAMIIIPHTDLYLHHKSIHGHFTLNEDQNVKLFGI